MAFPYQVKMNRVIIHSLKLNSSLWFATNLNGVSLEELMCNQDKKIRFISHKLCVKIR